MKKDYPLLLSLKRLEQDLLQAFRQEIPLIPFCLQTGDRKTTKSDVDAWVFLPDLSPHSLSLVKYIDINAMFHAGITFSLIPELRQETVQIQAKKDEAASKLFALAQKSSTSARRRKHIAEALEYLKRNEKAVQVWLALGQNEHVNPSERIKAAAALRKAGRREEAASLLLAYAKANHFHDFERKTAAKMLIAWRQQQQAAQAWLNILQDESVSGGIRIEAAEALGKLGQIEEAFPTLQALMQTREALAAREAARVAGEFGHIDEAKPVILAIAKDETIESWIRLSAAHLLKVWNYTEEYAHILLALAQDGSRDSYGQTMAAGTLADLGFVEEALPVLRRSMRDNAFHALGRIDAALTLARKLGHLDEARSILLILAQDKTIDEMAHGWIMEALEELG